MFATAQLLLMKLESFILLCPVALCTYVLVVTSCGINTVLLLPKR